MEHKVKNPVRYTSDVRLPYRVFVFIMLDRSDKNV